MIDGATTEPQDCPAPTDDVPQIRVMTTVDGTIITGKLLPGQTNVPDAPGAHMGINMHLLHTSPGSLKSRSVPTLECTSPNAAPTPSSWLCSVRAEIDIVAFYPFFQQFAVNTPIVLQKLPANSARACSVFEDGDLTIGLPDA